jgi:HSP20 family molecular chaperone IbpA
MTQLVKKNDNPVLAGPNGGADRLTFAPRTDIVESPEGFVLLADLPGVDESSLEVTLEKGVLTIQAKANLPAPEEATLAYGEFESGAYYRAFRISEEFDSSKIEASVKDGVLRVVLPRPAKVSRRIEVRQIT